MVRFETLPGRQGQFDLSPYTLDVGGELTKFIVFGMTLGYSAGGRRAAHSIVPIPTLHSDGLGELRSTAPIRRRQSTVTFSLPSQRGCRLEMSPIRSPSIRGQLRSLRPGYPVRRHQFRRSAT
jgi:hypothetical protein